MKDKLSKTIWRFIEKEGCPGGDYESWNSEEVESWLTVFAKKIRRDTLREERERNKRVAKMFSNTKEKS